MCQTTDFRESMSEQVSRKLLFDDIIKDIQKNYQQVPWIINSYSNLEAISFMKYTSGGYTPVPHECIILFNDMSFKVITTFLIYNYIL